MIITFIENKPRMPTKKISLATLLWICYSIFIVYATTIPFNMIRSKAELSHNIHVISWKPFYNTDAHEYFSKGDLIANVLFFIPFGFFGFYSFLNQKRPAAYRLISLSLLATCLSAFVEFLQMFTIDRNTSDTDLITNTLGAVVGLACAALIKPSSIRNLYNRRFAHFANTTMAFPLAATLLIVTAGALSPFDFGIHRNIITDKIPRMLPWSATFEVNKKELVVFLYYGALIAFASSLGFRQWRLRYFRGATIALGLCLAAFINTLQPFMDSRNPTGGSFMGILAGLFAGLFVEWLLSRHYRFAFAWALVAGMALLLLFFNFSSPMQSESKLGIFLRFSSRGTESMKGLMHFIEVTAQFVPLGFLVAYLSSRGKQRTIIITSVFFLPVLATPLFIFHGGLPSLYDLAVLIIAEIAVFIGAAACRWAWPLFNYYCRYYADT